MKRLAVCCLILLTALCRALLSISVVFCVTTALAGCASKKTEQPQPQPVVVRPVWCPRPAPPVLPSTRGLTFLESREGYAVLKLRDARMRAYIEGLNSALDCYNAQTGEGK